MMVAVAIGLAEWMASVAKNQPLQEAYYSTSSTVENSMMNMDGYYQKMQDMKMKIFATTTGNV